MMGGVGLRPAMPAFVPASASEAHSTPPRILGIPHTP